MIQKLSRTEHRNRYKKALNGCGPVGCLLGSRMQVFGPVQGNPWAFYTTGRGETPLALAVRGRAAWMTGSADPEQLAVLLRVMGVDCLTVTEGSSFPEGWEVKERLTVFTTESPLTELPIPEGLVIEKQPSLWKNACLVAEQPGFGEEARDNFYADSCALVNRGGGRVWLGCLDGKAAVTAGAYSVWQKTACLAAVYTQPDFRHRKLGRTLTARLTNSLCGEGLRVTLECSPGRERFYTALGFAADGVTLRLCPPMK